MDSLEGKMIARLATWVLNDSEMQVGLPGGSLRQERNSRFLFESSEVRIQCVWTGIRFLCGNGDETIGKTDSDSFAPEPIRQETRGFPQQRRFGQKRKDVFEIFEYAHFPPGLHPLLDFLPFLSIRSPRKRKGRGFLPANSPVLDGDRSAF